MNLCDYMDARQLAQVAATAWYSAKETNDPLHEQRHLQAVTTVYCYACTHAIRPAFEDNLRDIIIDRLEDIIDTLVMHRPDMAETLFQ